MKDNSDLQHRVAYPVWICALHPPYTIYGDGDLVGEYAVTLVDSAMCHADTALMYNKNTRSMAHKVCRTGGRETSPL